jgi:hypothetical protein
MTVHLQKATYETRDAAQREARAIMARRYPCPLLDVIGDGRGAFNILALDREKTPQRVLGILAEDLKTILSLDQ